MNNKITATLLIMTLAILAGCSSNPITLDRKALAANKIQTIDLTAPEQITYTRSKRVSRSTGILGGGMLGALVGMGIDGVVNSNRADVIAPILKAMGNYNTNKVFSSKLAALKGPSFAPVIAVKSHKAAVSSPLNVLNVVTSYTLSENHQAVDVSTVAKIKTSEKAPVYKRRYSANAPIDTNLKAGERINVTAWLAKNPSKLKQAIEQGMDSVIQQLSTDFNTGASSR
ncbi:MAG: hypothetical protein ACPG47_11615 [Leucothrix sp.]